MLNLGPLAIDLIVYGVLAFLLFVVLVAAVKLPTGDDDLASDSGLFHEPPPKVFTDDAWPELVGWQASASWREAYELYRPKHSSVERRAA